MGRYLIFPVTAQDREALGIADEFETDKTIGICLMPSRIREGHKRWDREMQPNPFEHPDASDVVRTLTVRNETLDEQHATDKAEALQAQESEFNEKLDAKQEALEKAEAEGRLKDTRIDALKSEIKKIEKREKAYAETVNAYAARYDGNPGAPIVPLTRLQRFIARLFRI